MYVVDFFLGLLFLIFLVALYGIVYSIKGIFELKQKKRLKDDTAKVEVQQVKVLTTEVISNYNDGSGLGPRVLTIYFLARENNGKYYELFSGVLIESYEETGEVNFANFNTPYIKEVEPLTNYLRNPDKKMIEKHLLFGFILEMNIDENIRESSEIEEDELDEEKDNLIVLK